VTFWVIFWTKCLEICCCRINKSARRRYKSSLVRIPTPPLTSPLDVNSSKRSQLPNVRGACIQRRKNFDSVTSPRK
jgi:hypothetical protein